MKLNAHVIQSYIGLLGKTVTDIVTEFEGIVTDVSFNIDGDIDVFVKPKVDANGKMQDGYWFDTARIRYKDGACESTNEIGKKPDPIDLISNALNGK